MHLSRALLACGVIAAAFPALADPVPAAALAVPPSDAQRFVIMSAAGKHGTSARWTAPDGTRMGRESMNLRGQIFETDSAAGVGADGMLNRVTVRGFTPNGDAAETFEIRDGNASWKSPVDAGSAPYAATAEYNSFGGTMDLNAEVVEALIAATGKTLSLLPGGGAHAEPLTSLTIGDGAARRALTAYAITGFSSGPLPVWVDDRGKFFAIDAGLTWIPVGYELAQPLLEKTQNDALAARSAGLVAKLQTTPTGPVAFTHVEAFVNGDRFIADDTVVVDKGVITAVGPHAAVPAGARIIDGHGKTLVPGLWDAHQHVPDDSAGPMLLSLGVTSVRDPGNITPLTLSRADRRAKGALLMPHVYPSMLIDGKGPNTAQVGTSVASLDEALATVRKAHDDGFIAIKFYGTFNPAWVAPTAAEAHRLGMHVHGHIPAGMRTTDAIADGYDEITHIYFVMMQAMPDSVVKASNGIARFEGPGRYAKDVDLKAEPMKSLIAEMAAKKIASDPTLVVAESLYVPENGDLGAAYAPYLGTLPPSVERGFRQGGFTVPKDLTRADYRASFARLRDLVGAMHKAGVPVVAGTDGSGIELVRELELYVQAGFTPAEALASATIATARLVGVGDHTGSIAVGKAADLVLVDGDPARNIGDLRHTRAVMLDGKLMDADALRAAGGFAGRPKFAD